MKFAVSWLARSRSYVKCLEYVLGENDSKGIGFGERVEREQAEDKACFGERRNSSAINFSSAPGNRVFSKAALGIHWCTTDEPSRPPNTGAAGKGQAYVVRRRLAWISPVFTYP